MELDAVVATDRNTLLGTVILLPLPLIGVLALVTGRDGQAIAMIATGLPGAVVLAYLASGLLLTLKGLSIGHWPKLVLLLFVTPLVLILLLFGAMYVALLPVLL